MATNVDYSSRDTAVVFAGLDDRESYSIKGGTGNDTLGGNAGSDTIQGGKGADIITGGAGADVFEYANGDGNDTIKDYEEDDVIKITSGTIDKISTAKNGNVTFKIGKGKIVVENAADKVITYEYLNSDGETVTRYYPVNFNSKGTSATLTAAYGKEEFIAEDFGDYSTLLKNIDASAVPHDMIITANGNANKIIGSEEDDVISAGKGKDSIYGGDGNDSIYGGAGNDYIEGGLGNDKLTGGSGSDTFVYNSGDGSDTILDYSEEEGDKLKFVGITIDPDNISKTSAGNVVFKIGSKKVTLKDAAEQVITYIDEEGEHTWLPNPDPVTVKGTGATLASYYNEDSFNIADYDADTKVKTIDASAVTQDLEIIGNKNANTITGGAGNDLINGSTGNDKLYGGEGADTFTYASGDGKDTIEDYEEDDIIQVTSGTISKISTNSAGNVVFKIGKGTITVKDAADKLVAYADAQEVIHYYPVDVNSAGTSATLLSEYGKDTFDTEYIKEHADSLKKIDASAVEHSLTINGNKKANTIIGTGNDDIIDGGAGADSITGGEGDDTLKGGSGKDVFIFDAQDGGADTITDFTTSDKIQIVGGTSDNITGVVAKNGDVLINYDGGSITLQDAGSIADKIKLIDENKKTISVDIQPDVSVIYNAQGTSATLTSYFAEESFTADSTLVSIDASAVTHDLTITANAKANRIIGSEEYDVIYGEAGKDIIYGGDGDDEIHGGTDNDKLYGDGGHDTLWGDAGSDTLTGGAGEDVFIYEAGNGKDVITDYTSGIDSIVVLGLDSRTSVASPIVDNAGDVTFKVGSSGQILVQGGANQYIEVLDGSGNQVQRYVPRSV